MELTGRPAWREVWSHGRFRIECAITGLLLVAAVVAQSAFMTWNEGRTGVVLDDAVLALFAPRDLSILTFAVIYASLAFGLMVLAPRPQKLVQALQTYVLLVVVRMGMMAVTPLDPPPSIIPLRDPLVELFVQGNALTRDLFFSGHTATVLLLALAVPRGARRLLLLAAMVAIAVFTVWQHTHYVVDVLVAPFVTYGCWRLTSRWRPAAAD